MEILTLFLNLAKNLNPRLHKYPEDLQELVKIIFNVIIFKKRKENIRPLTNVISILLKNTNPKFLEIISQQSKIILSFLEKGKQIEKALQSLIQFFKSSEEFMKKHFSAFIDLLVKSENRFLIQTGLDFLNHQLYHSNLKNEVLKNFVRSSLSENMLSIYCPSGA